MRSGMRGLALVGAAILLAPGAISRAQQTPPAPARPYIAGIAHVAIQTSDLARARAFYGDLLGFPEIGARRPHKAIFYVNDRQRLIVSDGLPPARDERFVDVAYEANIAAMRAHLAGRGAQPDDAIADADSGGTRIQVKDPDGHAIQFVELNATGRGRAATPDRRISRRILHTGWTVRDSAAADRFYKDTLGFSETWRGGRPEGTTSWINMRVPDGTDYLEYMLYPAGPPDRRQLGSAHHVALLVTDIQQALETVRARTKPDDRNHRANPSIGVNNRWQLNLFDPDGTRVELMEPWTVR
jgi:catechol 2,3-dioxygenase-like lactoylglutathione lyase family enzyme